jgi:hypothetical protein
MIRLAPKTPQVFPINDWEWRRALRNTLPSARTGLQLRKTWGNTPTSPHQHNATVALRAEPHMNVAATGDAPYIAGSVWACAKLLGS